VPASSDRRLRHASMVSASCCCSSSVQRKSSSALPTGGMLLSSATSCSWGRLPYADKCTGWHDAFALLHYRGDGDDNDCLASIAPPGQPGGAPMMDRRIFLTIVAGLLAAPLAARSQQAVEEGCSRRARSVSCA
jgi:hypothetical protein